MAPEKQVGIRGKIIHAQGREIIANVLKFMKKEAVKGAPIIPITNFKQRLIEATGVSEKTYRQVCKESELIQAGVITSFSSPVKGKRSKCKTESVEEQGEEETIRIIIHE